MPVWVWILIVLAVILILILGLILYFIVDRTDSNTSGLSKDEVAQIRASERAMVQNQLSLEQERRQALAKLAEQLRDNLVKLDAELLEATGFVEESRRADLQRLSEDNEHLGNELDRLLGIY